MGDEELRKLAHKAGEFLSALFKMCYFYPFYDAEHLFNGVYTVRIVGLLGEKVRIVVDNFNDNSYMSKCIIEEPSEYLSSIDIFKNYVDGSYNKIWKMLILLVGYIIENHQVLVDKVCIFCKNTNHSVLISVCYCLDCEQENCNQVD